MTWLRQSWKLFLTAVHSRWGCVTTSLRYATCREQSIEQAFNSSSFRECRVSTGWLMTGSYIIMVYYKLSPFNWVGFYPPIYQEWQGVCWFYLLILSTFGSFVFLFIETAWNCGAFVSDWHCSTFGRQLSSCRSAEDILDFVERPNRLSTGSFLNQKVLVLHVYQASSEVDDHGLPPQKCPKLSNSGLSILK